jgi:MYXO-CTERM domain-containing protein
MNRLTVATMMAVAVAGWLSSGCDIDVGGEVLGCVQDADCASCTDCDCTDCEDCAGCEAEVVTFPLNERMPNATQVRLSNAGLDFIEANAVNLVGGLVGGMDGLPIAITVNNGVISVPINDSLLEGADVPVEIEICPAGNCTLDVSFPSLTITPVDGGAGPDRLAIAVQVDLSSNRNTPITVLGNTCNFNFQTDALAANTLNVTMDIVFTEDGDGYGAGSPPAMVVDQATLQGLDLNLSCGGLATGAYFLLDGNNAGDYQPPATNASQSMAMDIIAELKTTLTQTVSTLMAKLFTFCQVAQSGQCPAGSNNVAGICMVNQNTCLPMRIGVETRIDASELLSNIFPGSTLIMDILFAMQGEAQAVSGGYNLNFFGGFENRAAPAACVSGITLANPPTRPTDIPLAASLQNSEEAHVVVGVAERMMDWAGYQLWEGGTLCIEAGTRLSPLLSTGLFSVLIRSLRNLSFPDGEAALAIGLRPQTPPDVTIGAGTDADPIVQVDLEALEIDFYVWSTERYVRFMTFRGDLHIALDIQFTDTGEIIPVIEEIGVENSSVFGSELLTETPEQLATAVEGVLPLISSFAGGLIPTIALGDLLGDTLPIGLELGPDSLRQVTQGNDRFLGVFVDLAPPATPTPFAGRVDTTLELVSVTVPDPTALQAQNLGSGERPRIEIALAASGPEEVSFEYQYRLNEGTWSSWSRTPYAVIDDPVLLLQGRHSVEARARVVGATDSADIIPARADFLIDVLAPELEVSRAANLVRVAAMDAVSSAEQMEYRWRSASREEWSEWSLMPANRLTLESAEDVIVEVRDENGNVASSDQSLRGLPPPSDGGGCGDCAVSGEPDASRPLMALALLLGMVGLLRRRQD